jgi:crossover junction endodeoxyribonuclease RuvC
MRILGIDCGTERTGWGVIESDGRRHQVVGHGVIRTKTAHTLEQRLCTIAQGIRAVLDEHQPQSAAVEGVFYSLNAKTAIKLAHVRGVALLTVAERGVALGEYSPAEIKSCVVGHGRAEKQQVQLMVRNLTGMRGEFETEDASDAVAVAICHATLSGVKRLVKVAL